MKQTDPLLPKLPALSELLQHPTVQRVVKRVNQTTVAQRATGFLEELRTNLRKRDVVPTIHHLAERLAQRLLGGDQTEAPVINATGVVLGERWSVAPLAPTAIDEILQLGSEYHESGDSLRERVLQSLCTLTGAESAWIAHSFAGALRLAREHATGTVDVERYAGVINPAEWGLAPVATIVERLAAGADVVVCDGGGLLGGPASGIIVGRRSDIERIAVQSWAPTLAADELTLAALAATLEVYRSAKRVIHEIPVLQLLSAPVENLRHRAERMAQLLAAVDSVASAKPRATQSAWLQGADCELTGPTWEIALRLESLSTDEAIRQWCETTPRVVSRTIGDEIHFDLRSVFPRWDQQLITSVENLTVVG